GCFFSRLRLHCRYRYFVDSAQFSLFFKQGLGEYRNHLEQQSHGFAVLNLMTLDFRRGVRLF
ncbi:hypothetical protein, partial [uncultured Oscillibacter sp.]|uniref:hypothetical protein n=1 Tax=uncultured Oscillibacter sp. TaxID=876091 RepID=UPI0026E30808